MEQPRQHSVRAVGEFTEYSSPDLEAGIKSNDIHIKHLLMTSIASLQCQKKSLEKEQSEVLQKLEWLYSRVIEPHITNAKITCYEDTSWENTKLIKPLVEPVRVSVRLLDAVVVDDMYMSDTDSVKTFTDMDQDSGIYGSMSDISSLSEYGDIRKEWKELKAKTASIEIRNSTLEAENIEYRKQLNTLTEENKLLRSSENAKDDQLRHLAMMETQLNKKCEFQEEEIKLKIKKLEDATTETNSRKHGISEFTNAFSHICKKVTEEIVENSKIDLSSQVTVSCEKCTEQPWDKDFKEIQDRLTEDEQNYVDNIIISKEIKVGFVAKYLTYRKVDYLLDNDEYSVNLRKHFIEKVAKTQRYIEHLKRENDDEINSCHMEIDDLHNKYNKLENDYDTLQTQRDEEIDDLQREVSVLQEEKNDLQFKGVFLQVAHEQLKASHHKLQSKLNENDSDLQVKKWDAANYYKNYGAPFAQSENEKLLKTQVDNLTNSKVANEKIKKQLKKEIKELEHEVLSLKKSMVFLHEENTVLQSTVKQNKVNDYYRENVEEKFRTSKDMEKSIQNNADINNGQESPFTSEYAVYLQSKQEWEDCIESHEED